MLKMVRGICALLVLVGLTGQAFVQTAKPPQILLLETGEALFTEDVKAKDGGEWLGLYVTKGGSSLIESKVRVKPYVDPTDRVEVPEQRNVSVDRPGKPVFLVKGATMLKPGPATTIYQGGEAEKHVLVDSQNLASRKPRQLKFGDQEYQLKVLARKAGAAENPNAELVKLQLALVSGKQTQIIHAPDSLYDMTVWRLLWAGDVEGDGKLDLYVQSEHGAFIESLLFLSSQAKPGQLVKEVAKFDVKVN
jgi:hypothetical protein